MNSRILIKIGSSVVLKKDKSFNKKNIKNICNQISKLKKNHEVLIVISGSIGSVSNYPLICNDKEIKNRIYASMGQVDLYYNFLKELKKNDINLCQILLTKDAISDKFKITTEEILKHKNLIPVVNANDFVLKEDSDFSDNDCVTRAICAKIQFGKVFFLSSVDGVINNNKLVRLIDSKNKNEIGFFAKSNLGTGGMEKKFSICLELSKNLDVFIANGNKSDIIVKILNNKTKKYTFFKKENE